MIPVDMRSAIEAGIGINRTIEIELPSPEEPK